MIVRVIDNRRIRADEHQVVGRRRSGNFGEVVVTQRVLPRERVISRDILLQYGVSVPRLVGPLFPCFVAMVRIAGGRVLGRCKLGRCLRQGKSRNSRRRNDFP